MVLTLEHLRDKLSNTMIRIALCYTYWTQTNTADSLVGYYAQLQTFTTSRSVQFTEVIWHTCRAAETLLARLIKFATSHHIGVAMTAS